MRIKRIVYRQPDGGALIQLGYSGDKWVTRGYGFPDEQWPAINTYYSTNPDELQSQLRRWIAFERRIGSTLQEIELCR